MELRHILASFLAYLLLLSKAALAQETSDSSTSTTTTTTGTTSTSSETAIVTNRFLVPAGYQGGRRTKDPELDPDVRWVIGSIVPIKWDFNVPGRVTIQVYQMAWDGMIWFEDIARKSRSPLWFTSWSTFPRYLSGAPFYIRLFAPCRLCIHNVVCP